MGGAHMPRTARLFIENAVYHIIVRSNNGRTIFDNDRAFKAYLTLVHRYKLRFCCLIYCYCLMKNHVHLLIESPRGKSAMSSFMKGINQTYSMIIKSEKGTIGHLWQDRYKSLVVCKDSYLHNLVTYIENNPVRAGIVIRPEDYAWSSYRARLTGKRDLITDEFRGQP